MKKRDNNIKKLEKQALDALSKYKFATWLKIMDKLKI